MRPIQSLLEEFDSAMLLRRKTKPTTPVQDAPLALRTMDGTLLKDFPSELVSSVRHMETTLICNERLPKRISVVAALGGEGVTYITLALATTLATDLAVRVCAVELNWWSPGMQNQLAEPSPSAPARRRARRQVTLHPVPLPVLATSPGLAAVLTNSATLEEALIPTALPNLMLLPAGDLPAELRPTLARSDVLKQCIAQLGQQFDHLILDMPAILSTSDAIALASLGVGCCIVIRQGITPVNSVRRALNDLQHLEMLGVVLNQNHTAVPHWVQTLIPHE